MNKQVIIGLVIAGLVIVGLVAFTANKPANTEVASETNSEQSQSQAENTGENAMIAPDEASTANGEAMMAGENKETTNSEVMTTKPGSYTTYSASAVSQASSDNGKAVLFFHASWCPYCRTADTAFSSRTSEIPAGVTVLKTDYDTNSELKKKYGVTTQHTFVQINAQGNQVAKWVGGDLDALKQNLK